MPYLHLETSADIHENSDIPDILEALCEEISSHPTVDSAHVRAFHSLRSVWVMGKGAKQAFVHLTVFVHSGRNPEWKKTLGGGLLEVLKERFPITLEADEANLTIDIREMDRKAYRRWPEQQRPELRV